MARDERQELTLQNHAETLTPTRRKFLKPASILISFWLLTALVISSAVHPAEPNIEALLADINRKPPDQRLKALIEGAKKEGQVLHYGSTNAPDNDEITRGFIKHYPFIEIRY